VEMHMTQSLSHIVLGCFVFFSFVHVRFIVRDVHRIVESSEVEKSRSLKSGRDSSCLPAS